MIFTKTFFVMLLLTLNLTHAQAANIDFNTIYNQALKACDNNQTSHSCKSMNESNPQCDSTNTKDEVVGLESSSNKPCVNVTADDNYVEPKFSTKRPRGQ